MRQGQALAAFDALANETRLKMLRYLVRKGPAGASAGEIGERVDAISSRASFHLAALSRAGLVVATRRSRRVIYTVDFAAIGALVAYLVEDCCAGHPHVRQCCMGDADAGVCGDEAES